MKKLFVTLTAVAMMVMAIGAVSAEEAADTVITETGYQVNFIDEDGDGVCDLFGEGGQGYGQGFIDEDGDGLCDITGLPMGEQGQAGAQAGAGAKVGGNESRGVGRSVDRGSRGARLQDGTGENEDCILN